MIRGIDISHHQGSPDFQRVKKAGIRFVMLKATEGVNYTDPCFHANIKAALAAGLPVGAYHFLRTTPLEQQAADFLAAIKPYKLTWPAALDVEHAELSSMGRDRLTDNVLTFCARIRAAGCKPLVYSNYNWLYGAKYLDAGRIRAAGIPPLDGVVQQCGAGEYRPLFPVRHLAVRERRQSGRHQRQCGLQRILPGLRRGGKAHADRRPGGHDRTILRRSLMLRATRKVRRTAKKKSWNAHNCGSVLAYIGWMEQSDSYHLYQTRVKPYVKKSYLEGVISRESKQRDHAGKTVPNTA